MNKKRKSRKKNCKNLVESKLVVRLAKNQKEIKMAQKLRYDIFAKELGAKLNSPEEGLDIDNYDRYCLHLLVIDETKNKIVGTYRILTPEGAKKSGGWYSDTEFDLSALKPIMRNMMEVGRACVHKNYRLSSAVLLLWSGLIALMQQYRYRYLIGCGSISMEDGGRRAATLFKQIEKKGQLCIAEYRVIPRNPLNLDLFEVDLEAELPTLIRGYLNLGAQVCGKPSVDPNFNTADLLILFDINQINQRYLKKILKS